MTLAERAAAEFEKADQVDWLARTAAEEANLLVAVDRALDTGHVDTAARTVWALWLYWWLRGQVSVGRRRAERCLRAQLPPGLAARAARWLALEVGAAVPVATGPGEPPRIWVSCVPRSDLGGRGGGHARGPNRRTAGGDPGWHARLVRDGRCGRAVRRRPGRPDPPHHAARRHRPDHRGAAEPRRPPHRRRRRPRIGRWGADRADPRVLRSRRHREHRPRLTPPCPFPASAG